MFVERHNYHKNTFISATPEGVRVHARTKIPVRCVLSATSEYLEEQRLIPWSELAEGLMDVRIDKVVKQINTQMRKLILEGQILYKQDELNKLQLSEGLAEHRKLVKQIEAMEVIK